MKVDPERPTIKDPFQDGGLPINLPVTRAINDNNPENTITSARLIVIKNSIVANNKEFTIENHLAINDSVHVKDTIPVGTVDLFIFANEDPSWGLSSIAKNTTCSPENIEKKTIGFSAYPTVSTSTPIPMYRQFRNLHISNEGTFTFGGSVITMAELGEIDRLYAKVTLVISAKFTEMANGGDPIKLDSVSVKSMPKHSYLTPSHGLLYPASGGYFNGARYHPVNGTDNYKADAAGLYDSINWYIPEHRLSDPLYKTFIHVKASLEDVTDVTEQVAFAPIVLGDGANVYTQEEMRGSGIALTNWFITRNTHYTVNARIKSFSKTNESEMTIKTTINSWNETLKIGDQDFWLYELTVSQDIFYIPSTGAFNGVVTVETNHPKGWNATGSTGVTFSGSSSLSNQTGTLLQFSYSGTGDGYIDITAGSYLVKRINIVRVP
jgi:hypothetical protein